MKQVKDRLARGSVEILVRRQAATASGNGPHGGRGPGPRVRARLPRAGRGPGPPTESPGRRWPTSRASCASRRRAWTWSPPPRPRRPRSQQALAALEKMREHRGRVHPRGPGRPAEAHRGLEPGGRRRSRPRRSRTTSSGSPSASRSSRGASRWIRSAWRRKWPCSPSARTSPRR